MTGPMLLCEEPGYRTFQCQCRRKRSRARSCRKADRTALNATAKALKLKVQIGQKVAADRPRQSVFARAPGIFAGPDPTTSKSGSLYCYPDDIGTAGTAPTGTRNATMDDTIGFPDPGLDLSDGFKPHTSHWGVFSARQGDAGLEVRAYAGDPDPNRIIDNFPGALRHQARITQPAIRRGWLERGPGRTIAAAATNSSPSAGRRRSICSATSWHASVTRAAPARCSAAPMAGRARAVSTTPRARCIASSTSPWAAMCAR